MNSIERLYEYINKNDNEEDWKYPLAPKNWPLKG